MPPTSSLRSNRRRRCSVCRIAHGIMVSLAAAALSACGAMTARTPPLPPVPHPALRGPAITQIQRASVLRVASDLSYPPMEFRENGAPRGFEIDLAALLAEALGVRLEVVDTPLTLMRAEFPSGVDMLLSAIPTESAAAVGRPSESYYVSSQAILWRDGSPVRTLQDMRGLRVAVAANSPGEALAAGVGPLSVTYLSEQALEEVATGRAQAAVGDRPALAWYVQAHPHLHVSAGAWREAPLAIVTRWEAFDLAAFVSAALREMKANGGLDQLRQRWHL